MPLDPKALDELRSLDPDGSQGLVAQVIESYMGDAVTILDKLKAAIGGADIPAMTREAHSLKSTSRSVGAVELSNVAASIELAGRAGKIDGCAALLETLIREYRAVEPDLRAAGKPAPGPV